ncbi:MAG: DMT family transporter [Patescibacteria group bacterium]
MWVLYALFFAVWASLSTLLVKDLTKKINYLPLLYALFAFSIPITFVLLLFLGGIPKVTPQFYLYMGASALLDTIAFVSSFLAISRSSISILSPISSFSPVFTTLIATVTIHEVPTTIKFIGILIVVFGAYLLNVADIKQGIMAPFKSLFVNKGVILFLLANLLWAVTPIFQKKAIFETSPQIPLFASLFGMFLVFLLMTPFTFKKSITYIKEIKVNIKWFVLNGIGTAFSQAAAYAAFSLVFVGYATSVFRLSTLFIIILGGVFLREKRIKERLLGGVIMLIGTVLLAL